MIFCAFAKALGRSNPWVSVELVTGCVELVTGCVELVTGCVVGGRGAAEITGERLPIDRN